VKCALLQKNVAEKSEYSLYFSSFSITVIFNKEYFLQYNILTTNFREIYYYALKNLFSSEEHYKIDRRSDFI